MYVAMASFDFTNIKDPRSRTRAAKHASYHRAFFVDLDGTMYVPGGLIPGAKKFVAWMEEKNIPFVFSRGLRW